MKDLMIMIARLILLCMGTAAFCGCSHKTGLLERQGIHGGADLAFAIIEAGNNYIVNDRPMLERLYTAMNYTVPSPATGYYRHNYVLLVTKNGHAAMYAFDITSANTQLRLGEASPLFTKFLKDEILSNKKKYLNKQQIPDIAYRQIERITGSSKRVLDSSKAGKFRNSVHLLAQAYVPYASTTQKTTWSKLSNSIDSHPGFVLSLVKPISFETLIGHTSSTEPEGAYDELKLVTLTIDKMLIYKDISGRIGLAFHSVGGGNSWFYTTALDKRRIKNKTAEDIYQDFP